VKTKKRRLEVYLGWGGGGGGGGGGCVMREKKCKGRVNITTLAGKPRPARGLGGKKRRMTGQRK